MADFPIIPWDSPPPWRTKSKSENAPLSLKCSNFPSGIFPIKARKLFWGFFSPAPLRPSSFFPHCKDGKARKGSLNQCRIPPLFLPGCPESGSVALLHQGFTGKAVLCCRVSLQSLENSVLLEIPEGKPQLEKPYWLLECRVLAQGTTLAELCLHC